MRNAAHRRQDEAPQEPPPRDLRAEAGEVMGQARALLPVLEARGDARAVNEVIILGLRIAELVSAMEDAAAGEAVVDAAYLRGRADEAAAGQQPSRPRHAARGRHLKLAGGAAVKATAVAAAAATATTMIAAHDSASVHHVAAPRPAAVRLHDRPDSAVPFPSSSTSPRPSAAAASARPAPSVTAVPPSVPPAPVRSSSAPPPAPVTAPAAPVLVAPGLLDLAGSHFGQLPLSVDGPGEVAWTATATDGIRLQQSAGVVVSGQMAEIRVDDLTGDGGWIYFSAGSQALAVHVMPLGAPVVALP